MIFILTKIGDTFSHNSAGNSLFTKEEFKLAVWSAFSDEQQIWRTDNQNMDPYNPTDG